MAENDKKLWSVLVYMAADANDRKLQDAAILNLSQMKTAGSNKDVYVVAQADLSGEPTRRYVFPERSGTLTHGEMNVIELDRNINSADPEELHQFFLWATETCPAQNILLILWGHGYGLDDYNPFTHQPPQSPSKAAFLSPRSLLPDAPTHTYLTNSQVANTVVACRKEAQAHNQNLAILGFDCCEMALLEVWFEMTQAASFGVGSQFTIPYSGWPYDVFLDKLLAKPQLNPQELCSLIVDTYIEYCEQLKPKPVVTLSACNFSYTDQLAVALIPLVTFLTSATESKTNRTKIFAARNASPIFDRDGFIDLGGFCRQLQINFTDPEISPLCNAVIVALRDYVSRSLFSPKGTSKKISLSTGTSIWFPPWIQYPDVDYPGADPTEKRNSERYLTSNYSDTQFATKTKWDKFLNALLRNTRANSKGE